MTAGELRLARVRARELACILAALGESVSDALNSPDPPTIANRLQSIVAGGVATLNELATISGTLAVFRGVR